METLAILTGLEIDAAKSGVKPDLSDYLGAKHCEAKPVPVILSAVTALAQDYTHCLQRIRASRKPITKRARQRDIESILFSRGQEDVDTDVLYALFSAIPQERISQLHNDLDSPAMTVMLDAYLSRAAGIFHIFRAASHYFLVRQPFCSSDNDGCHLKGIPAIFNRRFIKCFPQGSVR